MEQLKYIAGGAAVGLGFFAALFIAVFLAKLIIGVAGPLGVIFLFFVGVGGIFGFIFYQDTH